MNAEQQINQWGQIVAKAWQNDGFKKRLLANPSAVLKERGLEVPGGVQIRMVEDTDQILHLTLPAKPRERELSDAELAGVAGGFSATLANLLMTFKGLSPDQASGRTVYTGSPEQGADLLANPPKRP
jgi:hypothetical protein